MFKSCQSGMFILQNYGISWYLTHSHSIPMAFCDCVVLNLPRWAKLLRVLVASPGVRARAWSWPKRRWSATRRIRSTAVCWNALGSSLRRSCVTTSARWREATDQIWLPYVAMICLGEPCSFGGNGWLIWMGFFMEIHDFDAMNVEIGGRMNPIPLLLNFILNNIKHPRCTVIKLWIC